jgi:hypothetical protein
MALEEHDFSSVAELLRILPDVRKRSKTVWFRGQADHSWNLEPSLSRLGKLNTELQLIKQFKQNAHQFLESSSPLTEYDWIFLMQHYGVPTRLLDWTENPLIGMYFAVEEDPEKKGKKKPPAALWCLYPRKLNEISGLILSPPDDIPAFGDDSELDDYLPSRIHGAGIARKNPAAISAPRKFSRVYAQEGVFTILHRDTIRIDELTDAKGNQGHLVKLRIPRSSVPKIRAELRLLGVNKLTVFPQLENVAEKIIKGMS